MLSLRSLRFYFSLLCLLNVDSLYVSVPFLFSYVASRCCGLQRLICKVHLVFYSPVDLNSYIKFPSFLYLLLRLQDNLFSFRFVFFFLYFLMLCFLFFYFAIFSAYSVDFCICSFFPFSSLCYCHNHQHIVLLFISSSLKICGLTFQGMACHNKYDLVYCFGHLS